MTRMSYFRSPTFRTSIIILVLLIVTSGILVGTAAYGLYSRGLHAQAAQAQRAVEQTCDEIQALYLKSASGRSEGFHLDLANVVLRSPAIQGAGDRRWSVER